jgi:hypothetical protein
MHSEPQTTLNQIPAKPTFDLVFLANHCVANSSTPSPYVKYGSVRALLAPCALRKFVARCCVQRVVLAGDILGKLARFCALSTISYEPIFSRATFVRSLSTIYAHACRSYAHKFSYLSPPYFFAVLHINHRPY